MHKMGLGILLAGLAGAGLNAFAATDANRMMLKEGWSLQSSQKIQEAGPQLSRASYIPVGWYPTQVPSTVLAALVSNGLYVDPYFGMNLRKIPGTSYKIGDNFSKFPMPEDSPFRVSWWYRKEFKLPEHWQGQKIWAHFDGINYRANIWLNGKKIADAADVAGAYRTYEFEISKNVDLHLPNVLAVEVFASEPTDLGITWVDWNPAPADKNLGFWRDVYLTASGPVALRNSHVVTHLNSPANDLARLHITAEVKNATDHVVRGILFGNIEDSLISQAVELAGREVKVVAADLTLKNPRLWWPSQVGPQNLYQLKLQFKEESVGTSDTLVQRFGVREVTSELTANGSRLFKINGQNILIRGGGWAPDLLLRSDPEREKAEIAYAKHLNLNAIRFEGKMETESFMRLADENGILLMAGWCCCDHWERWAKWRPEDRTIAAESLRAQIRRLRQHPSVFTWLNGSDFHATPDVEQMYLDVLKEAEWSNPVQSSATAKVSEVTGNTGFKMNGPYDYVAPNYWLEETKQYGGAWGFSPETSPGAAYPPAESMRAFLPPDHQWPMGEYWDYHGGGTSFTNSHLFAEAQDKRYGVSHGLDEFALKAQVQAYETHRAMFEAFGRNKYTATGVVQWMLNNAWPGTIWHLYDYFLRPGGSYFGARKANEPLHIQYSYDDQSVVVVNSYYQAFHGLRASVKVFDFEMKERFAQTATSEIAPDSSTRVLYVPPIENLSQVYFIQLRLTDASEKLVSENFYWLPKQLDQLDYANSDWKMTPTKIFGDLTPLAQLSKVALKTFGKVRHLGSEGRVTLTIENPSKSLAFSIRLQITGKDGQEVLPILWDDNYFSLLPGEKKIVQATYRVRDLRGSQAHYSISGWNVTPQASGLVE